MERFAVLIDADPELLIACAGGLGDGCEILLITDETEDLI